MAFAIRNLSVLAYAQGFTLWHYKAGPDRLAESGDGYFDSAADMLAAGDMVMISGAEGGRVMVVSPGKSDGAAGVTLIPLG
jgi:hypothetical protein